MAITIEEIIGFKTDGATSTGNVDRLAYTGSFEVSPQQYHSYAQKDMESAMDHKLINALGNAKRAIHCQVDLILESFGFYQNERNRFWPFPTKLSKITAIGVSAPAILLRLNNARNIMEHDYSNPSEEQVMDCIDTAQIFIGSTIPYLRGHCRFIELQNSTRSQKMCISFDALTGAIEVRLYDYSVDTYALYRAGYQTQQSVVLNALVCPHGNPSWEQLIREYIGCVKTANFLQ
nr:hypothetical protein [uncultured Sediminibacterium sp.]